MIHFILELAVGVLILWAMVSSLIGFGGGYFMARQGLPVTQKTRASMSVGIFTHPVASYKQIAFGLSMIKRIKNGESPDLTAMGVGELPNYAELKKEA